MLKFIRFVELPVSDQDRAKAFYVNTLGLAVAQDVPYEGERRWISLEIPGAETKLLLTGEPDDKEFERPNLALVVNDVHQTFEELTAKGVTFSQEPTEAPWGSGELYALFRDSEGNTVIIGSD